MIPWPIVPITITALLFAPSSVSGQTVDGECSLTTCWTSFGTECEEGPSYCSFNDSNSYPQFDRKDQHDPRLVLIDDDIEIAWRGQNKSHPIRLSWHWWAENEPDESEHMVGVRQLPSMKWDKNITGQDPSTTINFWKLIQEDFPNNHTNLTSWEVLGYLQNNVTNDMVLSIYQPESPKYKKIQEDWEAGPGESHLLDYSNSFSLSQFNGKFEITERYFAAQYSRGRKAVLKKWRLGVGVGVGVGVPIITLLALFGGFLLGKKHGAPKSKPVSDSVSS